MKIRVENKIQASLLDLSFSDFPEDFNLFPTTSPDLPNFGTTDSDFEFVFDLGTTQNPLGGLFTTNSLLPGINL